MTESWVSGPALRRKVVGVILLDWAGGKGSYNCMETGASPSIMLQLFARIRGLELPLTPRVPKTMTHNL